MKMNWSVIQKDMNGKELFDKFYRTSVHQKRYTYPCSAADETVWRCCVRGQQWRIDNKIGCNCVRLVNIAICEASDWDELELYREFRAFLRNENFGGYKEDTPIALVLSGGGARGAYQIGAWKALKELGIDTMIGGVSGTSIGAVNTLLFALGDYETGEKLWDKASRPEFRKVNRARIDQFTKTYRNKGILNPAYEILENEFISQRELHSLVYQAVSGKAQEINRKYHLFSTVTPIEESDRLLQNVLLDTHNKATTLDAVHYLPWKLLSAMDITSAVLASAAIPIIYDPVVFKGKQYYDGGLFDNVPLKPLYQCGYRNFLVVHLNKNAEIRRKKDREFSDCRIVHVVPGGGFDDSFFSMLDLNPTATKKRIELGFIETLRCIDRNSSAIRDMMRGAV